MRSAGDDLNEIVRDAQGLLRRAVTELEGALAMAKRQIDDTATLAVLQVRSACDAFALGHAPDEALPDPIRQAMLLAAVDAVAALRGPVAAAVAAGDRDAVALFSTAFRPVAKALGQVPPHLQLAATRSALGSVLGRMIDCQVADAEVARANAGPGLAS